MRRRILTIVVSASLMAGMAGSALADAGPPGTTFPEQPGSHAQAGCAAVTTNPGTGFGGQSGQNASPTALAITNGLLVDACFGG
jgi:TRAP-type C4-dicarboxylate transport system permease large subunit